MDETFLATEAHELAIVTRGDFIESRHSGSAVVLAPDGSTLRTLGNPRATVLPRSAMKPFQAVAAMTSGVDLHGPEAAIATGSHAGTEQHTAIVTGMLHHVGLSANDLQCPAAWPFDSDARDHLVRQGQGPQRITMTCSGQHSAMLMACVKNGWDHTQYRDPEHPVQKHIRDITERLTGDKIAVTTIDGCGAPVHGMSLVALARGIQSIATSSESSPFALYRNAAQLRNAVLKDPWAIDGFGRDNTLVIQELGVFAKWGAEGVMVMTAPNGTTVTLKVLDGSGRAATVVALTLLTQARALEAGAVSALLPHLGLDIYGGGQRIGSVIPTV